MASWTRLIGSTGKSIKQNSGGDLVVAGIVENTELLNWQATLTPNEWNYSNAFSVSKYTYLDVELVGDCSHNLEIQQLVGTEWVTVKEVSGGAVITLRVDVTGASNRIAIIPHRGALGSTVSSKLIVRGRK